MRNLLTTIFALVFIPVALCIHPGGGDPGQSCRGHDGERECVGKRDNGMSGSYSVRVCRGGQWKVQFCSDGCYLLPRPRCRPTPKCQTEIDYAGGCVPLEDYQDYVGESDATDAD